MGIVVWSVDVMSEWRLRVRVVEGDVGKVLCSNILSVGSIGGGGK